MNGAKNRVSLVVTVKNDADGLRALLRAVEKQTRQPNEIILVVSQSSDDTLAVADHWQCPGIKKTVLQERQVNRSVGRNIGVQRANGKIIVFTDAGCRPNERWLEELLRPFADPSVSLVSGYTEGEWRTSWEEAQLPFVLVPLEKIEKHPLPATRNCAILRDVFLRSNGFRADLNYAEDFEFFRRLKTHGVQAVFAPKALVLWRPRSSVTSFFLMIARLTAGDIQAGIVRLGLLSMWLRYLFFAVLFFLSLEAGLVLYIAYVVTKVSRFRFSRAPVYAYALIAQVVCDAAVLLGSLIGLKQRALASALRLRENKRHAD